MNRSSQKHFPFNHLIQHLVRSVAMGLAVLSCCSCELTNKRQKAVILDSPSVRRVRAAYWAKRGYAFDPKVMTANQMDYEAGWNWPQDWAGRQEARRQADLAEKERKLAALEQERQSRITARIIRPVPKPLPAFGP